MQVNAAKLLIDQGDEIFCEKKPVVTINECSLPAYALGYKIDSLMQDLRKGPLVAFGYIGPNFYQDPPSKMRNQHAGNDIHYWKAGTKRRGGDPAYVIVLGVTKNESEGESNGFVYFTKSEDITRSSRPTKREHKMSDSTVYVVSHERFKTSIIEIFSSIAESDEKVASSDSLKQTAKDKVSSSISSNKTEKNIGHFVKRLLDLPVDSILAYPETNARCKAIGKEIFDTFKEQANGDSEAGLGAMQTISDTIAQFALDGDKRAKYIELAWNGVGDSKMHWFAVPEQLQ